MPERSADWMKQAERDLEKAKMDLKWQYFEWACFTAHQAAEKALKAVYYKLGAEVRGHSIVDLLKGLKGKAKANGDLMDGAKYLDRYYIPTRYPNGWAAGVPADYYGKEDAKDAVGNSGKIIRFCKGLLAK